VKKIVLIGFVLVASLLIYHTVKRIAPYEDVMQTQRITLDSIHVVGPVVRIYDKSLRQNFWLKSYTSLDATEFDSLQNKSAQIYYMKLFAGPLENRIFKIEVDSVIVFDQVIDGD
jgi:hypothetical protein